MTGPAWLFLATSVLMTVLFLIVADRVRDFEERS